MRLPAGRLAAMTSSSLKLRQQGQFALLHSRSQLGETAADPLAHNRLRAAQPGGDLAVLALVDHMRQHRFALVGR